MSKYIDADKLKAVLANHYQEITVPVITEQGGIESYFRRAEIHDILNIITSLQQEQPEVDLEKEIDDWYNTMGIPVTADALKETARHFWNKGYNARKEE